MKDAEEIIALQARGESITHIAILTKHGKKYISKVLSDAGIDTAALRFNIPNRAQARKVPISDFLEAIKTSYSRREALMKVGIMHNDNAYVNMLMHKYQVELLKPTSIKPKFYGPYSYPGKQPFFIETATKRRISAHKVYVNGLLLDKPVSSI